MIAIDYLPLIALGAVLGILGQSIRALIGIRKVLLRSKSALNKDSINLKYLILSLFIGLVVGCFGMLILQQDFDEPLFSNHIALIISLGYAGTDLIEGFFMPKKINLYSTDRSE